MRLLNGEYQKLDSKSNTQQPLNEINALLMSRNKIVLLN